MEHHRDRIVQDETFGCDTCQYRCNYGDPIAKGAYGIVYQAKVTTRGDFLGAEHVAVKVTHLDRQSELLADHTKWTKLRQRLRKLPELSHDHLVKYHKITIVKGSRGGVSIELMMDYHTGEDLRTVLRNLRQQRVLLSEAEAVSYAIQIAEGLQFLHEKQLIHGDLKPCNILSTNSENGDRKLAICDLDDIVQMERDGTCSRDITNLRGTYRFMSPEMLRKFVAMHESENPGRKTDMWSLGCIILELADCVVGNAQKWLSKGYEKIEAGNKVNDEMFIHLIVDGYVPCATESTPSCLAASLQQCLYTTSSERISASLLIHQLKSLESIQQLKAKEFIMIFRYKQRSDDVTECYLYDPSTETATELTLPEDLCDTFDVDAVLAVSNGSVLYQSRPKGAALANPYCVEILVWNVQKQTSPTVLFHQRHRLDPLLSPTVVMDKIYSWSNGEFRTLNLRDGTTKSLKQPPDLPCLSRPQHRARDDNRIIFAGNDMDENYHLSTRVRCFDTVTGEWEFLPDPPARSCFAMVVSEKTVYVLGGYDKITKSRSRSCLRLDLQSPTRQWETMSDLLHGRYDHCAFVSGNRIYAIGGIGVVGGNTDPSGIMEVYDSERDLWSTVSVIGSNRFFEAASKKLAPVNITLSWPVSGLSQ